MKYKWPGSLLLTAILGWTACQSPTDRLQRLQRDFIALCPRPGYFEVVDGTDSLHLPLPLGAEQARRGQLVIDSFRHELAALQSDQLPPDTRRQWSFFQAALDSLHRRPDGPLPDPAQYVLNDLLHHFIGRDRGVRHPGLLTRLIEELPAYYIAVETNWAAVPPAEAAETAVQRALLMLEQMDRLETQLENYSVGYRERLQRALLPARRAVKNYIGLCRSAWLER